MELEVALGAFLDTGKQISSKLDRLAKIKPIYKPIGGSAVSVGQATPLLVQLESAPAAGRIWNILRVGAFANDAHTPVNPNGAVTIPITAGAATRTLGATVGLLGFDVTLSTVGTAPGTVTITHVANVNSSVTLTYDINTGQQSMSIRFPQALSNAVSQGGMVVTFSQASAVGDLTLYTGSGSNAQTGLIDVYAGTVPDLSPNTGTPSQQDVIEAGLLLPAVTRFSRHVEWCGPMQQVYGIAYGIPNGQQVVLVARVAEYNLDAITALTVG
jgi:hypothetical protein